MTALFADLRRRVEAESYGHPFGDATEAVTTERVGFTLALLDIAESVAVYIAEPTLANERRLAVANLEPREEITQ